MFYKKLLSQLKTTKQVRRKVKQELNEALKHDGNLEDIIWI